MFRLLYFLICLSASSAVFAQTAVHDSAAETLNKKAGTIYVRKNQLDSASQKLLGIWGVCGEERFSKKHVCQSYSSTYEFLPDKTYTQIQLDKKGYHTFKGKWDYLNGKLNMIQLGKTNSKEVGSIPIIWLSSNSFYDQLHVKPHSYYLFYEKTNSHIGPALNTGSAD